MITKNYTSKILRRNILILSCIILNVVSSCDHGVCEAFNIERLPFDTSYYKQRLTYSNGSDTLVLFPAVVDYSKESNLNPMGNPDCYPCYAIEYLPKRKPVLDILYSFNYYPEENFTQFYIIIDASDLKIKLDSSFKQELYKNKKMVFDNFHQLNSSDSTRMVKKAVFESMRMTEIETYAGVSWRLIKVGNEVWR